MAKKKSTVQKQQIKSYNRILILLLFTVIAFILYATILTSPWVLDDYGSIAENDSLRNNSVFRMVTINRYIGYLSFAFNYKINTLNTFGYHVVNIIIHVINAFLVFILFRKMYILMRKDGEPESYNLVPLCIASIFLVHPLQTQAVTYIVQRFTSLSTLFALLCLFAYINFRTSTPARPGWFIVSLLSALLAYKTKENTATIPLMIIVIESLALIKYTIPWKKLALYVLPFFLVAAVIPLSMLSMHDAGSTNFSNLLSELKQTSYETPTVSRSHYLATEFSVVLLYMRLLILPINQSMHYLYPFADSFFELKTVLSFCVIAALLIISIIISKKFKEISFGIYWFFIFLLVESSIIPIQDAVFEHRLYLPSIGFISACVYLLYVLLGKANIKIFRIVMLIIIMVLAVAAYKRNEVWRDDVTLWKSVINRFPKDFIAHHGLGSAYTKMERCDLAVPEFKEAIAINPDYVFAHLNLAHCYTKQKKIDEALKEYYKAIELKPDYLMSYYNLSSLYYKQSNIQEAKRLLEKAKSIDDTHPMVNAQLARIHCGAKEYDVAFSLYQTALTRQPDSAYIHSNLAVCLLNGGKIKEGREEFFKAISLNPDEIDSYFFIGLSYDAEGDSAKALYYYKQFAARAPKDSPYMAGVTSRLQKN